MKSNIGAYHHLSHCPYPLVGLFLWSALSWGLRSLGASHPLPLYSHLKKLRWSKAVACLKATLDKVTKCHHQMKSHVGVYCHLCHHRYPLNVGLFLLSAQSWGLHSLGISRPLPLYSHLKKLCWSKAMVCLKAVLDKVTKCHHQMKSDIGAYRHLSHHQYPLDVGLFLGSAPSWSLLSLSALHPLPLYSHLKKLHWSNAMICLKAMLNNMFCSINRNAYQQYPLKDLSQVQVLLVLTV
jgi:hypothetical protein